MANNDTIKKTVIVALSLCLVCSVIVSTAAVVLKPAQEANKQLDYNRNILAAADLLEEGADVNELLKQITPKLVDLSTGKFVSVDDVDGISDLAKYDQNKAAKDPALSDKLSKGDDPAKILRKEKYAKVFLVQAEDGSVEKIVLPIKGYGLWGQLYGFLALGADLNSVVGVGFYDHKETPGLGGEVDNPAWKANWVGKQMYAADGSIALKVLKAKAPADAKHEIDGLSGATLTTRGVENLFHYWLGADGYGPLLNNLKKGEA
ncbi:MAG: Na(+)-translocating NADH-quinone reductase subunit C [Cellvibrionaceae bacterium]|nr:Na(+)-translocating NADH-quinone reductase subunit C [Cellvibrionaceae bacterium]MCV6625989.1 Na(+)-translocating NADH-quinone reductase subunit C [Cellvibrionaceae bacterium]